MAKHNIGSEVVSRISYTLGGSAQISFETASGEWTPPTIIPHAPCALPQHMTAPAQLHSIVPVPTRHVAQRKAPVSSHHVPTWHEVHAPQTANPQRVLPVQPSPPLPHMAPRSNPPRRDYMPGLGRWLSQTRLQEQLEKLEHPYAYAENNPVNWVDPEGLAPYWIPTQLGDKLNPEVPRKLSTPKWMRKAPKRTHRVELSRSTPPLLLAYGNYCGGGRSPEAGALKRGWKPPCPVDDLDACCQEHDRCWVRHKCSGVTAAQGYPEMCRQCNKQLAWCAQKVDCHRNRVRRNFPKDPTMIKNCETMKFGVWLLWGYNGRIYYRIPRDWDLNHPAM